MNTRGSPQRNDEDEGADGSETITLARAHLGFADSTSTESPTAWRSFSFTNVAGSRFSFPRSGGPQAMGLWYPHRLSSTLSLLKTNVEATLFYFDRPKALSQLTITFRNGSEVTSTRLTRKIYKSNSFDVVIRLKTTAEADALVARLKSLARGQKESQATAG